MILVNLIVQSIVLTFFLLSIGTVSASEIATKKIEVQQKIPTKFIQGTVEVVKHRMKNNLHLFSSHSSPLSQESSSTYFFTTNEKGNLQWILKLRLSNNSPIFCSQNEIIDTENETIFAVSIPKGETLFVNEKTFTTKNETNVLLVLNKWGAIVQSIKFTTQAFNPEFGLVVSQANSDNSFICLVEKRNSLMINNLQFGEKDGLYLLRFSKEKSSGQYNVIEKNNIGFMNSESSNQYTSLAGIQLYLAKDNQAFLYSNYPNSSVSIHTTSGYIPLYNKFFNRYLLPNDIRKNYRKVHVFLFNNQLDCRGYWYFAGSLKEIVENENSNFILLQGISYFRKKDSILTEIKNSLVQKINLQTSTFDKIDSLSYNVDFLRSQDNYKTSNLVTSLRYVYDSQLLKHYKILRRFSNEKLEDVISMEEPLIDSKSVISKDGKYIHCMVAVPKNSPKSNTVTFVEYTVPIKNEEMFKIEKNKVADKK